MRNILRGKAVVVGSLFFATTCLSVGSAGGNHQPDRVTLRYTIDLTRFDADSIGVSLDIRGIDSDSAVFQFAATAPGTYDKIDAGRFVGNFRALDKAGISLPVLRRNVNQFVVNNAHHLSRIVYDVDDTQESPIKENPVISASGSNLEKDNAVISPAVVCGYVHGFQSSPVAIAFRYPDWWKVGTALEKRNGAYFARSYDELVDSPFLFGDLTTASLRIDSTTVDVYCYSEKKLLSAQLFADSIKPLLSGVEKFLGRLPVPRYVYLLSFKQKGGSWALEHNYSSLFALKEDTPEHMFTPPFAMNGIIVHEFCHIITPLHIHSDVIEPFNFETPTASRHLWLYEGVTEWITGMALLAGKKYTTEDFLKNCISSLLKGNDLFDTAVSLVESSLGCYDQYERESFNAYAKAPVVATLMDIRLKEQSGGAFGLRELLFMLINRYGEGKPFADDSLFEVMVSLTNPDMRQLIDHYLLGTTPLPMKEYMAKVGYDYIREKQTGKYKSYIKRWQWDVQNGVYGIVKDADTLDAVVKALGIRNGDRVTGIVYRGEEISKDEARYYRVFSDSVEIGEPFALIVDRDGKQLRLSARAGREEVVEKHNIVPMEHPGEAQLRLRRCWLGTD